MSNYLFRLEVPADKRSFTVAEALKAAGIAIHPDSAAEGPVMITSIDKVRLDSVSGAQAGMPIALDEADWDLLRLIWSRMDPPAFPMTLESWQTYFDAFNSSRNKPEGWSLIPTQRDPKLRLAIMRAAALHDHKEMLKRAVNSDAIALRNPLTGAAHELGWLAHGDDWLLTLTDFRRLCDLLAIEVVNPPSPGATRQPLQVGEGAQDQRPATSESDDLPAEPIEKRAMLLKWFRERGGRRPNEPGKKGTRGALTRLVEKTGIDKDTLGDQLDKAIQEKRSADAFAQLAAKR